MEQSSAAAAVDPDRLTIRYFENGGAHPQLDDIAIVAGEAAGDDKRCATFSIKHEDHTLGNALRHMIIRNPDVDFCGYSIPHPSEDKIHLRIQSRGPPAIDILRKGLDDLQAVMETLLEKFDAAVASKDYEHHPDLEHPRAGEARPSRRHWVGPMSWIMAFSRPFSVRGLSTASVVADVARGVPRPKLVDPVEIQRKIDRLPYFVERTRLGRALPVYTDFRKRRQVTYTVIRRIYGNIHVLGGELKKILPQEARKQVAIRPDLAQIRIKGRHLECIRSFLTDKGL